MSDFTPFRPRPASENDLRAKAHAKWRADGMPTAAAVVVLHGGLVLVESGPKGNKPIGLPGGKREPGETPLECAMRELEEETGATVSTKYVQHLFTAMAGEHRTAIFLATPPGIRKPPVTKAEGIAWVYPSTMLTASRFPDIYARCFAEIIAVLMGAR